MKGGGHRCEQSVSETQVIIMRKLKKAGKQKQEVKMQKIQGQKRLSQ